VLNVKPISTGSNILQWTLRDRATETVVGLCEGIREFWVVLAESTGVQQVEKVG